MYRNLRAEMARLNITQKEMAEVLKLKTEHTFCLKASGKAKFTLNEANEIRNYLESKSNVKFTLEYLFETD